MAHFDGCMPSPLAHVVVGAWLGRTCASRMVRRGYSSPPPGLATFAGVIFSLLPDADAVPGVLIGEVGRWHNGWTHSILAWAFVGFWVWLGAALLRRDDRRFWLHTSVVAMGLHLAMDFVTVSRGLMLAWPFSRARVQIPWALFYGLRYSEGWWSFHHVWTIGNEVAVLALFAGALWASRRLLSTGRRTNSSPT